VENINPQTGHSRSQDWSAESTENAHRGLRDGDHGLLPSPACRPPPATFLHPQPPFEAGRWRRWRRWRRGRVAAGGWHRVAPPAVALSPQ
jgi:hypothetical protein